MERQVSGLWEGSAGRPAQARRAAPPHWCGLGVAAGTGAAKVLWKLGKRS